jgi:CRISPR-associated endonuclease/helicase Cas3
MTSTGQLDLFTQAEPDKPADEAAGFGSIFKAITGFEPFRWQSRLYGAFAQGDLPSALDLPTGLGKTSVMAIWLLARAANPALPRRLVYVVDRRAVVDQATTEAEKLKKALRKLPSLAAQLHLPNDGLPVSTLRGQFADNRDWLADPTASAIVVGTIDMTGSRLLFEGYGVSRGMRPYHAGLLGADTLFVLDEAHLCPPFQALLETIAQHPGLAPRDPEARALVPGFKVLPLSATGRGVDGQAFRLTDAEKREDEVVAKRLTAGKSLSFKGLDKAKLADCLAELAWEYRTTEDKPNRVLVYCHSREDAKRVAAKLESYGKKGQVKLELLTGARRVLEREKLVNDLRTLGFLAGSEVPRETPAFLIATSAGEVGIDLDADHMVCDLVEFERMAQRLGRVNRRGEGAAQVVVVPAPQGKEKPDETEQRIARLRAPFDALPELAEGPRDASPSALLGLKERAAQDPALAGSIEAATTPAPLRPELNRALVDAWSLTALETHTGRPDIQPWLRGWIDKDQPTATVAWREHLPWRKGDAAVPDEVGAFFEAAPLHLSETLEALVSEVVDTLIKRAAQIVKEAKQPSIGNSAEKPKLQADSTALLLLDRSGQPKPFRYGGKEQYGFTVGELAELAGKDKDALFSALMGSQAVIQRGFGGMNKHGLLDEKAGETTLTLDHGWEDTKLREIVGYRVRLESGANGEKVDDVWRVIHRHAQGSGEEDEADGKPDILVEAYRGKHAPRQGDPAVCRKTQGLAEHLDWTGQETGKLADALGLPENYRRMLVEAAEAHDLGKNRALWQDAMGADPAGRPYAKTTGGGNPRRLCGYRHEFGSLGDAEAAGRFGDLPEELRDLALHLVAAHHGHARPVIPPIDPAAPPSALKARAQEAALRFARLQRRWGPWGLAWWEAVFRAADQRASRRLDQSNEKEQR